MQKSEPKDKNQINPLKRSRPESEAAPELNKWWDKEELFDKTDKNEPKWEYLEHNGVQFPAFYKPHKIRINHKGEPISLSKDEEELATYWSQTIGSEWETKPIYRANFSKMFLKLLGQRHPEIKHFDELDFGNIVKHLEEQKELKRNRGPEEKKVLYQILPFIFFKNCFLERKGRKS